jgi:hypothetical protein
MKDDIEKDQINEENKEKKEKIERMCLIQYLSALDRCMQKMNGIKVEGNTEHTYMDLLRWKRDDIISDTSRSRSIANEYYKNNKDKLFPRVDCSCGKTIYKYYLGKHLRTNIHKHKLKDTSEGLEKRSFDIL